MDEAELLSRLPVAGILALVIVAIHRGWIVTADRFREMREDRDYWRSIAEQVLQITERVSKKGGKSE